MFMESNPHHPFSPQFGEHYWSGGASEKTHTFLHANHLPTRFATATAFTVAELGFGTALNFLLTAHLWQQTASLNAHLTFISYELHPLTALTLAPIHAHFPTFLQPLSHQFLALYQPQPGWNQLNLTPQITLHLYVGDATLGLTTHPYPANAWFLDGFSPVNNPAMWTPDLFLQIAHHTTPRGTASTYSVARKVRDALQSAGFTITQIPGYPPKGNILFAQKKEAL